MSFVISTCFVSRGSAFSGDSPDTLLVCTPNPQNVIVVFKPLMKFVMEIESKVGINTSNTTIDSINKCQLRIFVEDFVSDMFLPRLKAEIAQKLDGALKSGDSWHRVVEIDEIKRLGSPVPLLLATVRVVEICRHLCFVMGALPTFSDRIAEILMYLFKGEVTVNFRVGKTTRIA